jgi:hypothetical protein
MSNDEAKFILHAYRSSGRDASDPQFAEALAQTKQDPTLGRWFAREQAYDATIAAKLRAIEPPTHLRESILAGMRAEKPARKTFASAQRLALAVAAIAILGVFTYVLTRSKSVASDDQLVRSALDDQLHGKHGGHGSATGELQRWLAASDRGLANASLPLDYDKLRSSGCRTLSIAGREVLEVCFSRGGPEYHLYIAKSAGGSGPTLSGHHLVASAEGQGAMWSAGGFDYAVVTRAGARALEAVL